MPTLPRTSDLIAQLRFPLILLVTFAHSYSAVRPDYQLLASPWDGYEVLKLLVSQSLTKVVVPVFFIISGYLFFANVGCRWDWPLYRQKLLRRCRTLLLPYLLWNALMAVKLGHWGGWHTFWDYWPQAGCQTDWLGLLNLMTAPANMPLWFLRDLMCVTLLTPLLYWLLARPRRAAMVLSAMVLWFLSGVAAFAVPGLSACALCFFALGAWVAIGGRDLVQVAMRCEWPAYVVAAGLLVAMVCTYGQPVFSSLMLGFRLTGSVAVLCLGSRVLMLTRHRLPTVVSRSSYLLYLGHYVFFLSFVDRGLFALLGSTSAVGLCLHYLLSPVLKSGVFLALYAAYHKFSLLKNRRNLL